ncbi:hypothetical protein BV20DRAFT_1057147 [Pilatotrama ljubarskyi]|nr:hypothetical protein BV20DRAFT_1057147 [Pilatotrama ljubarskyi]
MDDGEPLERVWAITNTIARQTKEMSAGHWHDVLNDHYSDLNTRRVLHIVEDLVAYLNKAEDRYGTALTYMVQIEQSIEKHHNVDLEEWRDEERAFKQRVVDLAQHKHLENPYEPPRDVALTANAIAAQLKAECLAQDGVADLGGIGAVEQVLQLEASREVLRRKIKELKAGDESARSRLADEVADFRRLKDACDTDYQACIQPALDSALKGVSGEIMSSSFPARDAKDDAACGIPSAADVKGKGRATALLPGRARPRTTLQAAATEWQQIIEDGEYLLPSDLHSAIRTAPATADLLKTERKLREGQANEALDNLRLHLTTHLSLNVRRTQGSGVVHNTQADRRLQAKRDAINEAKEQYRAARHRLIVLGMPETDQTFRVLQDSDCRAFVIVSEEQRAGDSYRDQSWIWGNFSFAHRLAEGDIKKFVIGSVKVHWFRQSALKSRWEEEVELRWEEMWRTLRFFEHEENKWLTKSRALHDQGLFGAAAAARREGHCFTRLRDRARTSFPQMVRRAEWHRVVLLSIFKAEANARAEYRWRAFVRALTELGFTCEQQGGVIFRFRAPERWGGQVLVYHKIHSDVLNKDAQDYISTRFGRKYGWEASTFR